MRQAHIFYKDQLAGILTENDAGYEFRYLPEYLSSETIRSASTLGIANVIVERLINKYIKLLPKFETVIQNSFLSTELKEKYGELLKERLAIIK